jgi:hypothetical protein
MATPIDHIGQHELNPTLRALAKADGTTEHADWIRSGENAAVLIAFIDEQRPNPFEMTVEQQIAVLRRTNSEEGWGITEDIFTLLAKTAPPWPRGGHVYRSLRIRFGEGDEGVAKTFEAHCSRIKHVFGERFYGRWKRLQSGETLYRGKTPIERLRLLNGNRTHKPVIEWITANLNTHRKRESVDAVRGPKSLADELLVIAWMFPDAIRSIDDKAFPGLFAAGYEVNVPEFNDGEWQYVVAVRFRGGRVVDMDASPCYYASSDTSVPTLVDLKETGS